MSLAEPAASLHAGEGLTRRIVDFVVDRPASEVPQAALDAATLLLLDTVGVALAASVHPVGEIMARHVAGAPGPASIIGRPIKASPAMAALANGTLANTLDYDAS